MYNNSYITFHFFFFRKVKKDKLNLGKQQEARLLVFSTYCTLLSFIEEKKAASLRQCVHVAPSTNQPPPTTSLIARSV